MSLFDRIRSWLRGGDGEGETAAGNAGSDAADAASDDATSDPAGLDPENVERTRTSDDGGDDAAARLRDLKANRDEDDS